MTTSIPRTIIGLLIASLLVAGCANLPSTYPPGGTPLPANPAANASTVAQADNLLTADLYAQLSAKQGNLVFSPWSAESALAMTMEGAEGQTHDQMAQTLHLTQAAADIRTSFQQIDARLNAPNQTYQLSSANALWVQQGYTLLPDYLATVRQYYGGAASPVDFKTDTEGARQTINSWVEQKTEDKIRDLIPDGVLTAQTRLVLTNAVYFKAKWASPFNNDATTDQDFFAPTGTVTAKLMHQTQYFDYAETKDLQIVGLPYKGPYQGSLSMVVILPKTKDGLPQLEQQLTAGNLQVWEDAMKGQEVEVYLPKFNFTFGTSLKQTFQDLGMTVPFTADANFSGMTSDPQGLYIGDVLQKAFIATDEEGTEAAAATAVVMPALIMAGEMTPPPVFRADHPFIFLIKDDATGAVLFAGRVEDPTAS